MEQGSIIPYPGHAGNELAAGTVRMAGNDSIVVEIPGCLLPARTAASCLVRPEIGDRVLVFRDPGGEGYVLAVLARASEEPVTLGFERGVTLDAGAGPFAVDAPEIRFEASERISLAGPELAVRAERGTAAVDTLAIRGRKLDAAWEQVRSTIRFLDEIRERVVQKIDRCYRTVTEFEESRIGRLRMIVEGRFALRSKQATLTAEEAVKIDGEQIHLG